MIRLLDTILQNYIKKGQLEVFFPDGSRRIYGESGALEKASIKISTLNICCRLILNPGLAFGEGYMEGVISPVNCSLFQVLMVLLQNDLQHDYASEKIVSLIRYLKRSWAQFNSVRLARKHVAHHYDLNGALYDLFLDSDRQYSCGYFHRGDETLEEAQEAKKWHIASKLLLNRPGLKVLDIGSGWGGMAIFLAKHFKAQVTGITLSEEQLHVSRDRVEQEGLSDQIHFELLDYRSLHNQYDRIVSVGMFEHVGVHYYPDFFKSIREILQPDGVMLLHSIGRSDGPGSTNPWINKYIFPGGYSPALSETFAAIEQSGLWVTDCEVLRLHYAKTIHFWRENFEQNKEAILKLYDEQFYRMFEVYLAASELTFHYQNHMNFQLQISPSLTAVPLTRDYMVQQEGQALSS